MCAHGFTVFIHATYIRFIECTQDNDVPVTRFKRDFN